MTDIDQFSTEADLTLYTERDLQQARRRGKMAGWIQGGVAVIAGSLILKAIGWIPTVLVVGVVAYGLYRLLGGGKKTPDA